MLVYGLYTERYVGSSTVLGANLCWIKDLIAALTEKEMEAQRAEVTWPRSPSKKVLGPSFFCSYLSTSRPGIHTPI